MPAVDSILMASSAADISQTLRCPTCNASQVWSDECRRCKSDLRFLRQVVEAQRAHHHFALQAFAQGRYLTALVEAQHAYDLYPDAEGRQLLASCHLMAGNWQQAVQLAADATSHPDV